MRKPLFILCLLVFVCKISFAQLRPLHTVVVVLENHSYSQVAGNALVPYINSLLADSHTAVFTQSYGLTHPSQPNYLQLFSGSAQGVTNDYVPTKLPFVTTNLGAALIQNKFSFTGYSESLPSAGATDSSAGNYKRKHNSWVNWQGTGTNGIPQTQNKPFTAFPSNFSDLPTVAFVIPNQENDMHNGTMAVSFPLCDAWLKKKLDKYIQWCKTNSSLFILTFDEDDGKDGNHILTFITGENVKGGNYEQRITHYNVLRTIEDFYQLPYAGASKDSAAIKNAWLSFPVCAGAGSSISSNVKGSIYQWQVNTGSGFTNVINNTNYAGSNTANLQLNNVPSSWNGYQYRCNVNGTARNTITLRITNYFTGAVSNAWENPQNWSCGSLPDRNTDVSFISAGALVLNSDISVRSLTLGGAAKVSAASNKHLTITHR